MVQPSLKLLEVLDTIREQYGHAITVTSGVRCPAYNAKVGGVVNSEHITGEGADLLVPNSLERFYMIQAALQAGITRIGVGETFLHVGINPSMPQHIIWLYAHALHG